MIDTMNEITQFSPFGGSLTLVEVPGDLSAIAHVEAENEARAGIGAERDMYAYAPLSGCPDMKQCQVLMVLRDGSDEASAQAVMRAYGLDALAEEKHCLLLFPNPLPGGWNYDALPEREDDMSYLIRCFGVLRKSKLGVNGFNGMTFYVAASQDASALLMTLGALKPIHVPAMMITGCPNGYTLPDGALHVPVAAWVCGNTAAADYLRQADRVPEAAHFPAQGHSLYFSEENPNIRLVLSAEPMNAAEIRAAWEELFSETRRWQNDVFGTYQWRTNFTERGFVPHVRDTSLGVNGGFAHTWYEYVPPQLRGSKEKIPLVFYFHGGGCVPLYGAEQSGWHDIADRENFIVVYPKASKDAAWNAWNTPDAPSDEDFMLALIEHMKAAYAIDERRIYVSGFSMGGMMSNAMACAHPELIAAAAPCNAYLEGYFCSRDSMMKNRSQGLHIMEQSAEPSPVRQEADAKKAKQDYRMPVFQTSGLLDQTWPIPDGDNSRIWTFNYWKAYNNIPVEPYVPNPAYESGLTADETVYDGEDGRFLHHQWFSRDEGSPALYELFLAKRMPHALDLRAMEYAWAFMKKFSRCPDGTLQIRP